MRPMIGVSTAPPIIDMVRSDAPILVFLPRPSMARAKIVGYILDMKKLDRKIAECPDREKANVDNAVDSHQPGCSDLAHQGGRSKAPNSESEECPGEKIAGDFLWAMGVVLHILDEVTPGAYLCSNVHELSADSCQEMRIAQQMFKAAVSAVAFDALRCHGRKAATPNEDCQQEGETANDEVGIDYPQRLIAKIPAV